MTDKEQKPELVEKIATAMRDTEVRRLRVIRPYEKLPEYYHKEYLEDAQSILDLIRKENWKSPEVWEQIRDISVFLAVADERKVILTKAEPLMMYLDALKSGQAGEE